MDVKKYIGARLRELREDHGWTAEYVGDRVGKKETTVRSWERGRTEPNGATLVRLCQLFGVDISYFFDLPLMEDGDGLPADGIPSPTRWLFGRRFQSFRKAAGLNVEEVGERLGYSGKTISAWEVGKGGPKPEEIPAICEMFSAEPNELFNYEADDSRRIRSLREQSFLDLYRSLDEVGRTKLHDYADDLVSSGKYERKGGPTSDIQAS